RRTLPAILYRKRRGSPTKFALAALPSSAMFGGLTPPGTTREGEAVQNALPHFVAAELWDHFIGEADLVDRVLPERQALLRKQQVCKGSGCKGAAQRARRKSRRRRKCQE